MSTIGSGRFQPVPSLTQDLSRPPPARRERSFVERNGEPTERNRAQLRSTQAQQPRPWTTEKHPRPRTGAGRSQVQILSPRSKEIPAQTHIVRVRCRAMAQRHGPIMVQMCGARLGTRAAPNAWARTAGDGSGSRRRAGDLLESLPAEQRHVLRARYVDGRDYVEIAAELGSSEGVVRKRASRGLKTLRDLAPPWAADD